MLFRAQLLVILAVASTVTVAHFLGAFSIFDLWEWDFVLRNRPLSRPSPSVLIISLDSKKWPLDDNELIELTGKLESERPAAIVYTFHLSEAVRKAFQGRRVVYPLAATKSLGVASVGQVSLHLPAAMNLLTPAEDGVHRKQQVVFATEFGVQASVSLAALVVAGLAETKIELIPGKLRSGGIEIPLDEQMRTEAIFVGPRQTYPYIPVEKVLNGDIPEKFLTDKMLFLGPTNSGNAREVKTSTTLIDSPMPEVEYWAQLTGSLLVGRVATRLQQERLLVGLFVSLVLLGFLFSRLTPISGMLFSTLLVVVTYIFNLFAIEKAYFQVPFYSFRVGLVLLLAGLSIARVATVYSLLTRIMLKLKLRKRGVMMGDLHFVKNWWEQAADLALNYLDVEAQVFFEKLPAHKHMRVAYLRGISADEIVEKRRDYTRTPFVTALEIRGPIFVSRFLSGQRAVLLVPMVFGKVLLGYWVIAASAGEEYLKRRMLIITLLARELSASLFYNQGMKISRTAFVFSLEDVYLRLNTLEKLAEELLNESNLLSSVLNTEVEGVVACDLLGRVFIYNNTLVEMLSKAGLELDTENVFNTVHRLVWEDQKLFREELTYAVLRNTKVTFRVNIAEAAYSLIVRPIVDPESEDVQPHGLVLILQNIEEQRQADSMKDSFIHNIFGQLQNYLTPIVGYSELLCEIGSEEERQIASVIYERAKKLAELINRVSPITDSASEVTSSAQLEVLPTDMIQLLTQVIKEVSYGAYKRQIEVQFEHPNVINFVVCPRKKLYRALVDCLEFLIVIAPSGATIKVSLVEKTDDVELSLSVIDFSLPQDLMDKISREAGSKLLEVEAFMLAQGNKFRLDYGSHMTVQLNIQKGWN
ncbi:MAG: CHASE2 domain-containing protein [Acidobacteriota bacterium]|nr:CHASE2 domain-containing protein [Blastocatellia bacterium]MDW8411207.1 CHASE2 domain-containing protein [Acidobacteriota bacterium]